MSALVEDAEAVRAARDRLRGGRADRKDTELSILVRDLRRLVEGRADDESIDIWIIPHSGGGIGATAQVGAEMGGVGADLNVLCPEGYDLVVVKEQQICAKLQVEREQTMSEQKPSVGRIVHYIQGDAELALEKYSGDHYSTFDELAEAGRHLPGTNGTRVHPALITQVWSDTCVNLHVFFDATPSVIKTSVTLIETPDDTHNPNAGWCWPPRV